MTQYLVVSDLHLVDVETYPERWKDYKSPDYVFDDELAALVAFFVARCGHAGPLVLVLNGDVFDFDLVTAVPELPPWPVSDDEYKHGLDATAAKSAWKLERVLSHHPRFVRVLAEFVGAGHQIIYVLGNHDRELFFAEVKQVLIDAIDRQMHANQQALASKSLVFEPWFYYVPGEIFAEHGHQYDYYTSFRHLLHPVVESDGNEVLALPMGNLSNRYLINSLGYFNPFASDYILNLYRYVAHWFRHYCFSRRSIVFPWFFGSLAVIWRLLWLKRKLRAVPAAHLAETNRTAEKLGLSLAEIQALGKLQQEPVAQKLYRVLRELWIDRVIIALVMSVTTVVLAIVPIPLWIKLMLPLSSFPLLYFIYEWFARDDSVFRIEKEIPSRARAVSKVLPARVITFGHTHVPRLIPLGKDTVFVDTGTWAPIPQDSENRALRPGYRNYLVLSVERGVSTVEFGSWMANES